MAQNPWLPPFEITYGDDIQFDGSEVRSTDCSESSPEFNNKYYRYQFYIDNHNTIPIITIPININIWQNNTATDNWQNTPSDITRLNQVVAWINGFYSNICPPSDPIAGVTSFTDSRIRFELNAINYNYDPALWSSTSGAALQTANNSIDANRANQLNIHVTGGIYSAAGFSNGPSSNPYIVTFNNEADPSGDFAFATHLAHELGHNLGLYHPYDGNNSGIYGDVVAGQSDACCPETNVIADPDFLDDVFDLAQTHWCVAPVTQFCYHNTGWGCNVTDPLNYCTNNLLGGTQSSCYLSPKQIAKAKRTLFFEPIRRIVKCEPYTASYIEITSDEIWDFDVKFYNPIKVKSGVSLTIKCKVALAENHTITVEPGGKLIIDGGTLTSHCGFWQGIEAIGNPLSSIQSPSTQAFISTDNATIEKAYVAIRGGEVDATYITKFNQGGAIVQVKNSTFKNNWIGVQFTPYKRFFLLPSGAKVEQNNLSFVTNCTFINDAPLTNLAHSTPNVGVSIWGARGINLKGNTFENSRTDITADLKGVGIRLLDATNTFIIPYCSSLTLPPCPSGSEDKNEFKNLYMGIETLLGTGVDNVTIDKNQFTNCVYGIKSSGSAYLKTTNNMFEIPFGDYSFPGYSDGFGIFMSGVYGFNIEENFFFPHHNAGSGQNLGVLANNTSTVMLGNKVFRNEFGDNSASTTLRGLTIGTQTAGNNSTLEIDCNRYYRSDFSSTTPTKLDIHIAKGSIANQGNCDLFDLTKPHANEFYGTSCGMIFNNAQIWKNFLTTGPDLISPPLYESYSVVGFNDGCNNWGVSSKDCLGNEPAYNPATDREIACPTTLPGTSTGITVIKAMTDYNFFRSEIETLSDQIDGGDTQALVDLIGATSDNTLLRGHLLSFAPYLSDEVLITLIKKNSPSPAVWVLNDVLAACAPPTEKVLKALLAKTPSLPPTMLRDYFIASAPVQRQVMIAFINKTGVSPSMIKEVALANSPLFSDELIALINLTPKLSPSALNDILLLNTPLTPSVTDALNARNPALPKWVWDNINNSTYETPHPDTRVKTYNPVQVLTNSINYANTQKLFNLSWLVSHYLDSNYVDSALGILYNDGSIEAMCAMVPVRIDRGQIPEADLILTFIYNRAIYRQNLDLDDPEAKDLLNFVTFHNTMKELQGSSQGYFSITSAQRTNLELVAGSESPVSANAQAVLNFIDDKHNYEPAYPIDEESNPRSYQPQQKAQPVSLVKLHCYPNPSNGNVNVEIIGLNESPNGSLVIFDVTGKIIQNIIVNDEYNSYVLKNLESGMYNVVFIQKGLPISNERVIITK